MMLTDHRQNIYSAIRCTTYFVSDFDMFLIKVLYARDIDQRGNTFEKALSMGKEYQRRCKVLLIHPFIHCFFYTFFALYLHIMNKY